MSDFYTGYTFIPDRELRHSPEPQEEIEKPVGGVMWINWKLLNEWRKVIKENKGK